MLIVFEGVDRSGKSTQVRKLVEHINSNGGRCETVKLPNRLTVTGQIIDRFLKKEIELDDKVVHLLFSANRWEMKPYIEDLLADGVTVVLDRYIYSAQAYGDIEPKDVFWYQQADVGLPKPDLVFLLDSKDTSMRGEYGGERYERPDFLAKVREKFLRMVTKEWRGVDADQSIEAVHAEILGHYELLHKVT